MRDLGRGFDLDWWRDVRYDHPERLLVGGALLAAGLAVAGFLSVSTLGGGGSANQSGFLTTSLNDRVHTLRVVRTSTRFEMRPPSSTARPRRLRTVRHVITEAHTITIAASPARTLGQTHTVVQTRTVVRTKANPALTVTVTVAAPPDTVTETVTVTTTCKRHCGGG